MIMISDYIVSVMGTCSVMEFPSSSSPELLLPSLVSLAGAAACAATSLDSAADSGIFVSAKKLQYELRLKEQRLTELVNMQALVWEVPSLIPMYDLGLRSSRPKCWVTWLEIISCSTTSSQPYYHFPRLFLLIEGYRKRYILHIYTACFVSSSRTRTRLVTHSFRLLRLMMFWRTVY